MHGSGHHHDSHHEGHDCGCGGHHGHRFQRRFVAPKEKAAKLREYLADLKAEAAEVEKRIKELEQEG